MRLTNMNIRYAQDSDLEFLLKGRQEVISVAEHKPHVGREQRDREELKQAIDGKEIRVMEIAGQPVAFLEFKADFKVMYVESGFLWIHFSYVREDYRRKGLGKLLYEDAAKIAADKGLKKIALDVFAMNLGSAKFHQRLGFKPLYTIYEKMV